jgi:hypothetical protein
MVDSFSFAPCCEHVVCEVVNVVVRPLIGFQVRLGVTPLGLNGVGVIPLLIHERNGVINPFAYTAGCETGCAIDVFAVNSGFVSVDGMTCLIPFES